MGTTDSASNPVACLRSNCVPLGDQRCSNIRDSTQIEKPSTEPLLAKQPLPRRAIGLKTIKAPADKGNQENASIAATHNL